MALKKLLKKSSIITFILILIIGFNLTTPAFSVLSKYTNQNYWKNFSSLEKTFNNSQYVNKNAKFWIPDETAFSYAAGKLITGTNPVLVVPDAPPLGKYIIGLSALLFNNENTFNFLAAAISLVMLYLLSFQIFKNSLLAIIPTLLFSFEPIFKNQIIYTPLLDIYQLVFILSIFIFFNKGLTSKKSTFYFLLSSIFLGLFISTKFFITGFVVIASLFLVILLRKDFKKIVNLSIVLPISLIVLIASYSRVLAFGYTLFGIFGIQKWVYLYHQSFLILPFSVWPLLLLNHWYVWFGEKPVISDPQWVLAWPIFTLLTIFTIVLYIFKKIPHNKNIEIAMSWVVLYLAFLSIGQTFSRYLIILLPMFYIISAYGVISIYKKYIK